MAKYYSIFWLPNGTHNEHPYEDTNLKKAVRDIREIAEGQVNGKEWCSWEVKDENGKIVAKGGRMAGIRQREI